MVRQLPDLASHVKHICSQNGEYEAKLISQQDRKYMASLASQLNLNSKDDPNLEYAISQRWPFFTADFLLALLPNIECLMVFLEGYSSPEEAKMDKCWFVHRCAVLQANGRSVAFPNLRMLRLTMTDYHGPQAHNYSMGALLRAAPNLENLAILGLSYMLGEDSFPGYNFLPRLKRLKTLDLLSCELSPEPDDRQFLSKLVSHADRLEKVRYWTQDRSQHSSWNISARQLLDIFIETGCNKRLQHLDIDVDVEPADWGMDESEIEDLQRHIWPLLAQSPA